MTAEDSSSKESREQGEGGEKTQMARFTLATTITYLVMENTVCFLINRMRFLIL